MSDPLGSAPDEQTDEGGRRHTVVEGAEARREDKLESELEAVVLERDVAESWADRLASAIGHGAEGEHSNLHNPWEVAEEMVHAQQRANAETQARVARTLDMLANATNDALAREVERLLRGDDEALQGGGPA